MQLILLCCMQHTYQSPQILCDFQHIMKRHVPSILTFDWSYFSNSSAEYQVPNRSCIVSQKLDANNLTRYLVTWQVGVSMEIGINLGILDIVVSAPVLYMKGSSRGLLGRCL